MTLKRQIIKIIFFLKKYWILLFVILAFTGFFAAPRIVEGFTSVESLSCKCREKSLEKFRTGAVCDDGWRSNSTGRGTCSHHGGVKEWVYGERYNKSYSECEEWAKQRSWIE